MRRLLVVFSVAFLGLSLVAATPPQYSTKPTVIVFPFTANGSSIDREASSRLATIIATQMANTGKVIVLPPPPGTERKDYLTVARANDCDYYVAGFISALGNGVSVVEQVVSTTSGIVVFSNTAQLNTYADAAGQGDDLGEFVIRHANRAYASIGTPPPVTSPTPQPAAQTSLNRLFGRKKKAPESPKPAPPSAKPATPAPAKSAAPVAVASTTTPPAAVAVATRPPAPAARARRVAVLPVGGDATPQLRIAATQRIVDHAGAERAPTVKAACGGQPYDEVLTGLLEIAPVPAGANATFALTAADCRGKTLWSRRFSSTAGGTKPGQLAMERAIDAALSSLSL